MLYQLFIYPIELLLQTFYTFFMLYLGNPGFAIAGVSIAVTVFTLPLYNTADRSGRGDAGGAARVPRQQQVGGGDPFRPGLLFSCLL